MAGPLVFGPLSEIYGRTRPMCVGLLFFTILQVPVALAQNLPAIFICRFLTAAAGSSVIAIFPAMTVDLFSASDRGPAVNLYLAAVIGGPCLGPVTGGFIVDKLNWRWTIWIVLIATSVLCLVSFFAVPETCEAVLLQRKAAQIRYETKNWAMHTKFDEFPITWQSLRQKYMLKPIFMLCQEPIVSCLPATSPQSCTFGRANHTTAAARRNRLHVSLVRPPLPSALRLPLRFCHRPQLASPVSHPPLPVHFHWCPPQSSPRRDLLQPVVETTPRRPHG